MSTIRETLVDTSRHYQTQVDTDYNDYNDYNDYRDSDLDLNYGIEE